MAKPGLISVKCRLAVDRFDQFDSDFKQATSDGLCDALVYARDAVKPYTPFDPINHRVGPHLNQPEIHRYDNGTVSMQWRASNNGFYYAEIQNNNLLFNHPHGGGPGFADMVAESFSQNAPDVITNLMNSRGWY